MAEERTSKEQVGDLISRGRKEIPGLEQAAEDDEKRRKTEDRSGLTRVVIWVWAIGVVAAIGYLVIEGLLGCKGLVDCKDIVGQILEVLKVAVVPIVTFIIGYYFGTAK
jgi:hypothetical protein